MKGCKCMSKERLLSAIDQSESGENENNFNNARIKKIREDSDKLKDKAKNKRN